jgi:hypothetical protein
MFQMLWNMVDAFECNGPASEPIAAASRTVAAGVPDVVVANE